MAVGALLAVLACGTDVAEDAPATVDFPPTVAAEATPVAPSDFVGAEACAECHADEYRQWATSTHGRAGGTPGPEVVIAPFDGRPIRFADAEVVPRVEGGVYEFVVRQEGFAEAVYPVAGVIGGGHMLGGGTQGFVARRDDGTERFLPWDWSDDAGTWFCNTGSRTDRGWQPIRPDMRLADCGDWPPLRPLGTTERFANCQECHGSQIRVSFDSVATAYRTEYTTLQVNCESCHGPARGHVEAARGGTAGEALGLTSLVYRDKDASLETCFQCHALKDVLREGYLPGQSFTDHYALKFPALGDRPYYADGRVRTFAYQANHLASACYLEGPMDCVSCHEPHGQGYWDVNREPLDGPYSDGQCTACHASKGADGPAHTFHPADSEGSRCVSCHMPYLQHPEVGDAIPFARSDHTIAIPRPVFDADLGLVSACAGCHEERTPLQLQGEVRAWWGELKPHRPLVVGQVQELRARNVEEAGLLLLRPDQHDPLIQFQALSRLLMGYLRPDDPSLSADVRERLKALTRSADLDVRALALAALHWSLGGDGETRALLVDALSRAPRPAALRDRWVLALGFLGDHYRERGEAEVSESAYRKALEIQRDDPRIQANLALLYSQTGRTDEAVALFRTSLGADPGQPLGWVNLGIALAASGDPAGAQAAYAEAIRRNPHEALAHFNLGNLHQRAERLTDAVDAYRRAVSADPGLGRAHFEVARTLIRLERYGEALPHARRAVEFLPDHLPSRQMLSDLLSVVEGP